MNIRMKRGMALVLTASLLLAGSAQALFMIKTSCQFGYTVLIQR